MATRITISVSGENNERYEDIAKRAVEDVERSDNVFIVARGKDSRKPSAEPVVVKRDISFYVAHSMADGILFKCDEKEDMIRAAVRNTIDNARIAPLLDLISCHERGIHCMFFGIDAFEPQGSGDRFFVLTNKEKRYGAGILFFDQVLHKIWEKVGNYYIIPSSIHELILFVDKGDLEWKDFAEMIRTVNLAEVAKEERLSDDPFYYDGSLKGGV